MGTRPALVAENDAALPSRRAKAADNQAVVEPSQSTGKTRSLTIYCDVAATVRSALFGFAAVVIALTFFVVAWRGGSNYPTTTSVQAIAAAMSGSEGKPAKTQPK